VDLWLLRCGVASSLFASADAVASLLPNMRLKLAARGRRQKRKAQNGAFSLIAPAAGCSLSAIR